MRQKTRNVLILLGSRREDGNSTRLAFAFADAASRKGLTVQSIRVPALAIAPCDGCGQGWETAGTPCVLRDDMDSVYPLLRAAEVLVFATPLHFFAWSAPLKTLVDRLYCLSPERQRNLKGRQSILLATAADDNPRAFAGLRATYRLIAGYMGWKPRGEILVPDVDAEGEIARRVRFLAKADALGSRT